MKVLIAAADGVLRRTLATPLRGASYEVVEVERGAAACAALRGEGGPRIALLALDMPDLDGLEVCRRLRRSEAASVHETPMLILVQDAARDAAAAISAGADDVITLPLADALLIARVAQARRMLELRDDRARSRAYLDALLSSVSTGVLLSDASGRIALANDALGELLGADARALLARPRDEFLAEQADRLTPRAEWLQALRAEPSHDREPLELELAAVPAPRAVRWLSRPVTLPDGRGCLDVFRDVTLELEVQQERALMAMVDLATGLYSRRGAGDTIERELARVRRNGTKLSVALFTVLGAAGARSTDDEIMRKLGDTLSLTTRMTDITVRWTPDTLLVVLPEAELDDAAVFVERVLTSARVLELSRAEGVTLGVGTAEYDASETDLDAAVARAGQALGAPEQT